MNLMALRNNLWVKIGGIAFGEADFFHSPPSRSQIDERNVIRYEQAYKKDEQMSIL